MSRSSSPGAKGLAPIVDVLAMQSEMLSRIGAWGRARLDRPRRWLREIGLQESGQGLLEYGLVLLLVSVVAVVALAAIGHHVTYLVSTTARRVHP